MLKAEDLLQKVKLMYKKKNDKIKLPAIFEIFTLIFGKRRMVYFYWFLIWFWSYWVKKTIKFKWSRFGSIFYVYDARLLIYFENVWIDFCLHFWPKNCKYNRRIVYFYWFLNCALVIKNRCTYPQRTRC